MIRALLSPRHRHNPHRASARLHSPALFSYSSPVGGDDSLPVVDTCLSINSICKARFPDHFHYCYKLVYDLRIADRDIHALESNRFVCT